MANLIQRARLLFYLMLSADLFVVTSAFRIFDELDITITEANTTYMKSETRYPDLYVQLAVVARSPDGTIHGKEASFGNTEVMIKDQNPNFKETIRYVRYQWIRYTFGTDNVIIIRLMDQAIQFEPDLLLGQFELDLSDVADNPVTYAKELVVVMKNETLGISSSIGYKVHFVMHHEEQSQRSDVREDDYEADDSDSPLYHVHRVMHDDGSVEEVAPDGSAYFDWKELV